MTRLSAADDNQLLNNVLDIVFLYAFYRYISQSISVYMLKYIITHYMELSLAQTVQPYWC